MEWEACLLWSLANLKTGEKSENGDFPSARHGDQELRHHPIERIAVNVGRDHPSFEGKKYKGTWKIIQ